MSGPLPELPGDYPQADAVLGERLVEGEVDEARALIRVLGERVRDEAARIGHARRDAHAKSHGCVRARLDVDADIPLQLSWGVFKPGARYDATIRFSNGTPRAPDKDDDIQGDMRGMAIKLHGVPGRKLFHEKGRETEHDFILISKPYFFINGTHRYAELFAALEQGGIRGTISALLIVGPRAGFNAWRMLRQQIADPLETRYWSLVPYQLGLDERRIAVKYSVRPCTQGTSEIPEQPGKDYLRKAMAENLSRGPACMVFMIQPRTDEALSVEDVVKPWPEDRARFYPVARLTFPQQLFDTPEQNRICENESFNPWRVLPEHKPLGAINRTRRVLYEAISELRHELNGVGSAGP